MESQHSSKEHLLEEKHLFSEEEINNISALVQVLKQIRKRLLYEGTNIDNFKKHSEIRVPIKK